MSKLQKYNIFPEFREGQLDLCKELIKTILQDKHRDIIVEAPTGYGKSIVAYIVSAYLKDHIKSKIDDDIFRTYISTSQKMLQDQYENDFEDKIAVIKGGDNYKCAINGLSYPEGNCHYSFAEQYTFDCSRDGRCEYLTKRREAKTNPITLSNLHYLLLEFDFVGQFEQRDLFIIDEAHTAEDVLIDYSIARTEEDLVTDFNEFIKKIIEPENDVQLDIQSRYDPKHLSEIDFDKLASLRKIRYGDIVDFLNFEVMPKLTQVINSIESSIKDRSSAMKHHSQRHIDRVLLEDGYFELREMVILYKRIKCKISNVNRNLEKTSYIPEVTYENGEISGVKLTSLNPNFLVYDVINRIARTRIWMSATIGDPDSFCESLGLKKNKTKFISLESNFDYTKSPIIYDPIGKFNHENIDLYLPDIARRCDEIFEEFEGKKGIVHSVSYSNGWYLIKNSKYRNRLLIHNSENKDIILEEFYASDDKILISPSCMEGVDLFDDRSRFQIFIKIPFLSLGDERIKKKMARDRNWYTYRTILTMIQGIGRSKRSVNDYCTTYILDGQFDRLLEQKHMWPKHVYNNIFKYE